MHKGLAEEGKTTTRFRVGLSFKTQSSGVSTVGLLVNFQGAYGLTRCFRVGMILEWRNHKIDPGSGGEFI